jgi:hypothetical protein
MITVSGRIRKPVVEEHYPNAVTVIVRVDDDANPEFWAEVRMNRVDLEAMLEHMARLEAEEAAECGQ